MDKNDKKSINNDLLLKSVVKAFSILESFDSESSKLTMTELASLTGMKLPAIQRHTSTLLSLGYLRRGPQKEYFLGPKVLSLAQSYLSGSELRNIAENDLRQLSVEANSTVNLAILEGADALVLYRREVNSFFRFNIQMGSKLPGYCTSIGKVLLATLDDQELLSRIAGINFLKRTQHTITDPHILYDEIVKVRKKGYGTSDREASLDLYSIGVPILNNDNTVVAAINISLSLAQIEREKIDKYFKKITKLGLNLSTLLGYQGKYPLITTSSQDFE